MSYGSASHDAVGDPGPSTLRIRAARVANYAGDAIGTIAHFVCNNANVSLNSLEVLCDQRAVYEWTQG